MNPFAAASFTGSLSSGVLTVSASGLGGTITPGSTPLSGAGVAVGTTIASQLSGTTGGAGTYQTSGTQTVGSEMMAAGPAIGTIQFDGSPQNFGPATTFLANATIQHFTQANNYSVTDLSPVSYSGPDLTGGVCHGVAGSS